MAPKAKAFHFKGYRYDAKKRTIFFKYRISFSNQQPLDFTERLIVPLHAHALQQATLKKFLEPLHLILGISYYKLYCPPKAILPFELTKEQADFWNTVYRKGLGEFLYRNKLHPNRIARFPHSKVLRSPSRVMVPDRILLGIGGGKDSIVAAELLRSYAVTSFSVETQRKDPLIDSIVTKIGNPTLEIQRILDPLLFEKHPGSYNGHIPISAIYAFLGLLSSALYGYRYIVVGNEQSSNYGNMNYAGMVINHQWSKSSEFEKLLQDYTQRYITPDITYFSLLRQFYEIRIAELFAKQTKYHLLFSSCNRNFTILKGKNKKRWCGECPKCAFVFLILAPFMNKRTVVNIFGKNLLADTKLLPTYTKLLGFGNYKPFDCVGTFEEARVALMLAAKNFKNEPIVRKLLPRIKDRQTLKERVFATTHAPTVPTPFRFLGIRSVCILGYGIEGKSTERYLKKNYPHLRIGILDKKQGTAYLERQKDFDLAIRTPGIPKEKVSSAYTTATNIFFALNTNVIIGITGTKGKSTTTSLIYTMLKAAGKKVRLLGNIGSPMLDALMTNVSPDELFVIELSSYMLDDIEYSPNIALLLNLFPDHMNYHGDLDAYYAAKRNIFKYQKPGDIALIGPFKDRIPLSDSRLPLQGEHNKENIRAAIHVVRKLDISDVAIRKAVTSFKPLPHRLENVGTYKGITFYDDAISTTPESTIMAIKTLKNINTIFLGGEDRGYDFTELEKTLRKFRIRNIVLFPKSGKRILRSHEGFNILETKDMKKAVGFAYAQGVPGTICLLSTASPSYSIWKNFEEKGDLFKHYARKLGHNAAKKKK